MADPIVQTGADAHPADPATPAPVPVGRRRLWPAVLATLLLLLALVAGGAWWLWRSEAGLNWLLAQVPGLQVSGLRGRPDGGPFEVAKLAWRSGPTEVTVDGLAWRDLRWRWRPHAGAWVRIELQAPRATRIAVRTGPGDLNAPKARAPSDLRLPLELVVQGLVVDTLQINQLAPVTALQADLHLGDERGALHRIGRLAAQFGGVRADAAAQVGSTGSLALGGQLTVGAMAGAAVPWQARVQAGGTVQQLSLTAALTAAEGASATVQATLAPFAPWPLQALRAGTQALDLSALNSALGAALPSTSLSGSVVVDSRGADAPVQADVDLANARPGPWSAGRLPVRSLRGTVRGSLQDRSTVELTALLARLEGDGAAGQLRGSGRWQGSTLALDLAFDALRPAQLDTRAPAMTLSGPLKLALQGLPSPDPAAARDAAAPLAGTVKAQIDGRLDATKQTPVQLLADGRFSAPPGGTLQLQLERLTLVAGGARAALAGTATRDAQQTWNLRASGELSRFDPAVWFPGAAGSSWRRGPHLLNASLRTDVAVPAAATRAADPRALLLALRGSAELQLADSRLAGVPLQGRAALQAGAAAATLDAALQAAGNRVALDLRATAGGADSARATVEAPALPALAPLAGLVPGGAAWWPQAGTLTARASAEGAWPALQTQGELRAAGLASAAWRVGRADATWNANTSRPDAPLALNVVAEALAQGAQRLDTLTASVDGTLRAHRLQLRAASPVRPPAWVDAAPVPSAAGPAGTRLAVSGDGAWTPGPAAGGGGVWRGRVAELLLAPRAEAVPGAPGAAAWVAARNLSASLTFAPEGGLARAELAPGQADLLGATLRWTDAAFEAATQPGAAPRLRAEAQMEPLLLAPWLARLQPDAGWNGDLRVGGTLSVRSGQAFDADVVLDRAGGDLSMVRDGRRQAFGFTALRLALAAHGGNWLVTQAVTGTQLGVLAGSQTVRTNATAAWPAAAAPLEGVLTLQTPDLDVWSAWLPVGWSVGGALQATALLSGSFGAPEYGGRVDGTALAVRNLFQGVDVSDGTLAVALRGADARIERFVLKGGNGTLDLDGTATFGAVPSAQLRVTADKFQALSRVDRRIVVSGKAALALQGQNTTLDGSFTVDEGAIDISQADASTLDADVVVVNRPGAAPPPPAAAADPKAPPVTDRMRNTRVALQIDLGRALRLRGRGLDTGLTGVLRVSTPGGRLSVDGSVLTENGSYQAYGQNLSIERGIIRFDGELAAPRLDILAVRGDIDTRVGVLIVGSTVDPRIRLYSEPDMSDMDKLSWLVLGRASGGLGRADTALLQQAALALLAGEKGSSSAGFVKRLGLDELSVGQTGTGDTRDTVVTLGKQLSKRLFVGYERGLNATVGSWQLIYRVAQRFTIRASSGDESALDVIWTWRWD